MAIVTTIYTTSPTNIGIDPISEIQVLDARLCTYVAEISGNNRLSQPSSVDVKRDYHRIYSLLDQLENREAFLESNRSLKAAKMSLKKSIQLQVVWTS